MKFSIRETEAFLIPLPELMTGAYVVEGPRIEKMLGYTNLDSEKGFPSFFQQHCLKGIPEFLEELERAGIEEGDTVRMIWPGNLTINK